MDATSKKTTQKKAKKKTLPELAFWKKVWIGKKHQCWSWKGEIREEDGYGMLTYRGKRERAHRVAYALTHNHEFSEGEIVTHTCSNPACCNPNHLCLSDNKRNARKREALGIGNHAHGVKNGNAKLDVAKVKEIREKWANQKASQVQLASEFAVSQHCINQVVSGKTWREVTL